MKIKKTPYVEWLLKETNRDASDLQSLLVHEVYMTKNKQAMDLLQLSGDNTFSMDTFKKTAELILTLWP
jgi:hypothetical protein